MSVSRERTIIAEICDLIENPPPLKHGDDYDEVNLAMAKKIYELVVKKAMLDAMRHGVHLCETDGLRLKMQSEAFNNYMNKKV